MPAVKILSDAAQAVVNALTAGLVASSFSQTFVPERSYADWELALDDADKGELRCDVVPVNNPKTELDGRNSLSYTLACDLILRQKLNSPHQDEVTGRIGLPHVDNLVGLLLELHEFFCIDRFADLEDAAWEATDVRAAYVANHLNEHRQYTGVIRITFSTSREVGS